MSKHNLKPFGVGAGSDADYRAFSSVQVHVGSYYSEITRK